MTSSRAPVALHLRDQSAQHSIMEALFFSSVHVHLRFKWEPRSDRFTDAKSVKPVAAGSWACYRGALWERGESQRRNWSAGQPVTQNFQRQFRSPCDVQQPGSPKKGEGTRALLFLPPCTPSESCVNVFELQRCIKSARSNALFFRIVLL